MGERSGLPRLGPRGEGWVLIQLALFAVTVVVGIIGGRWTAGWRAPVLGLGIGLAAAGALLLGGAVRSLGPSLTPAPIPNDRSELTTTGPYSRVRHPIYGGLILIAVGWALLTSPWALIPAGVLAAFFSLKARFEEQHLLLRYGDDYRAYADRVGNRFVPFVW